jgi:hypothetical protein
MRNIFSSQISGVSLLETDDHKESWRFYRAMEDDRRREMDPELELATRESVYWRSQVDEVLDNIHYQINMFNRGSHANLAFNDNVINRRLAQLADQLNDLGWQGDRIPF